MYLEMSETEDFRKAYGNTLRALGEENDKIVVLDADVFHHTNTHIFEEQFPERFFQIGIAEQNLMGVSAGFAASGFIPFANTFAVFATRRPHDQISISIAYPCLNVKIAGSYAGLSSSNTGATHQAIDDIATMRSIPNMTIFVPGDPLEVEKCVRAAADLDGPVYLRINKGPGVATLFDESYGFIPGKAVVLKEGKDIGLIGTGVMTGRCLKASEILAEKGISAGVLHIPTIKPIDGDTIKDFSSSCGTVLTVEDHNIIGGLGSAVAEVLGESPSSTVYRKGIDDVFTESAGSVEELIKKYGLDYNSIADHAIHIMSEA